jgi:hypothetical protein
MVSPVAEIAFTSRARGSKQQEYAQKKNPKFIYEFQSSID